MCHTLIVANNKRDWARSDRLKRHVTAKGKREAGARCRRWPSDTGRRELLKERRRRERRAGEIASQRSRMSEKTFEGESLCGHVIKETERTRARSQCVCLITSRPLPFVVGTQRKWAQPCATRGPIQIDNFLGKRAG